SPTRGRDAEKVTSVGTVPCVAAHDLVALAEHVVSRDAQVRKRTEEWANPLLELFQASELAHTAAMPDEIRGTRLIQCRHISFTDHLVQEAADNGSAFFGRHG